MADKKESLTEKILRSVLISSKGGVPLPKLNSDFKELLGQSIPFKENGFPSIEAYLRSMPAVVQLRRDASGQMMCMGVANEETQHLDRLVKKQKASKKSRSKPIRVPRFAGRPNNWPRRPPPRPAPQNQRWNARPSSSSHDPRYSKPGPPGNQNGPPRNARPPLQSRAPSQQNKPPQQQNKPPAQQSKPPAQEKRQIKPPLQQNKQPQHQNRQPPPAQRNAPQRSGPSYNQKVQHSSSYEVPPRFRRQIHSTGSASDEHSWDDEVMKEHEAQRSHSASDYQSALNEKNQDWDYEPVNNNDLQTIQQPLQPPPVDEKIVSWVNETLAEQTNGLWMSGLKKQYKEKFQETMDDDLVDRLGRLSLWTAEEMGFSNDAILYPNMRRGDTKTLSTEDLRSKREQNRLAGNEKILYPSLKVEVTQSPASGNLRRNVANRLPSTNASLVPHIVLPDDELWDVYVSYVINVMDFYCIIIGDDYSDQLCTLEDDMRDFYHSENTNMQLTNKPTVDGLYAAQLNDDWLRVKIIAMQDDEAGCFLVDHGDVESVPFEDLRFLDQKFFQLPFQAIPCKLHGIENKAASEIATTRFCNVALAQTRLAEVMSRESRVSLTLYRDTLNINYLCAMGELL